MNDFLVENIHNILQHFNINYEDKGNRLVFPCPIHGSDNEESLSILLEGRNINGVWSCFTRHCEEKYGKNLFGLIKGLLSSTEEVDNKQVAKWIYQNVGKAPHADFSLQTYLKIVKPQDHSTTNKINRSYVRQNLKRPAQDFINRGFSEDILDKYDVGVCYNKNTQMYMRTVIPVYDDNHEFVIGCIGRTRSPLCRKCGFYHIKHCPTNNLEKLWGSKWINSNFDSGSHLFNLWYAKKQVYNNGTIILVEGALDCIRLEQAGIHNSVALFGDKLTDNQHNILNQLPLHTVIISTDRDSAGQNAGTNIKDKLSRYFNIKEVYPIKKDWAEHSPQEIKEIWGKYEFKSKDHFNFW